MARIKYPWVMTRQQVKDILQITSADEDMLIDRYLPIVSADIVKITNNHFIVGLTGDFTAPSTTIENVETLQLDFGNVVSTPDFQQASITDIDDELKTITTAQATTSTDIGVSFYVNIFPESKKPIAAQMVWYNIQQYAKQTKVTEGLSSESIGSYSYTVADVDAGTIAGYPRAIVRGLREITIPRFN